MNSIKIPVKSKDFGWWSQEPITVHRKEDDTIIWCNHHGAVAETQENTIHRIDEPDIDWQTSVEICDKCQAYKIEGDDYWQESPVEGVR